MIRFVPYYQRAPWGGRRLADEFGRANVPEGEIGEAWELCELPERHSRVGQGPHEGKTLGELWRAGSLGGSAQGDFPFLLKWIDAEHRLSVQVHPDEAACARLGKGSPKSEAWFIAQAEPKAVLHVGHYPGLDPATLRQAAGLGTMNKWLYETRPRPGEMVVLPGGTIHCIGGGFLLLEVQQPSDSTYRIYDWGRIGADGHPRPLHIEEACASVDFGRYGAPNIQRQVVTGSCYEMRPLGQGTVLSPGPLRVLVADSGGLKLETQRGEQTVEYGEVVVAEPDDGQITIGTGTAVLVTEPGQSGL